MTQTVEISEKIYSVEEWLELEKRSDVRHEFYYGKLIPLPGEAKNANRIAINLIMKLNPVLAAKGLELFAHEVKTQVRENGIYRYPDLVVAPIADDEHDYIVKLPVMLVEVASEDSGNRDRIKKRREYRQLPTLWYYLIVSQDEMLAELHLRTADDDWATQYFTEADDEITLPRFEARLRLSEIYERIKILPASNV